MGTAPKEVVAAVLPALIALLCAPIAFNCSPHYRNAARSPNPPGCASPALADLDQDFVADSVRLRSSGSRKTIDIRFADLRTSKFSFITSSSDHGSLVGKDIDADGDLDLVWIGLDEQRTAVVLINDGKGNFTEAKDNAPYAVELEALLSDSDPPDQPFLQAAGDIHTLVSSTFFGIAVAVASRFTCPAIRSASFAGFDWLANQSVFLSDLRKRGPPLILS